MKVQQVFIFVEVSLTLVHGIQNLHDQFCESPSNKQPCNNNSLQDEDMMVEITATTHTSPKAHVDPEILNGNEISTIVQKLNNPNEVY